MEKCPWMGINPKQNKIKQNRSQNGLLVILGILIMKGKTILVWFPLIEYNLLKNLHVKKLDHKAGVMSIK